MYLPLKLGFEIYIYIYQNRKKACCTDGIAGELIKYGGTGINEYDAKRIVSAYVGK